MAALAVLLLALAVVARSEAAWCVCKSDLSDTALQTTLDYACGAGADCSPVLQNGACYSPNTVKAHCSYAANSYFQRKGQAQGACDFSGTATLSATDPSYSGCTYPATASSAGTSSSTPGAAAGILSPPSGVFGGLGPSSSLSDNSGGSLLVAGTASLLLTGICSWMLS